MRTLLLLAGSALLVAAAPARTPEQVAEAAAQLQRCGVERRLGLVVLHEVAELGLLFLTDRLLERHRVLGHAEDVAHLVGVHLELLGDLLGAGLAAEALHELALDVHDLVQLLNHVHGNADRARLVGNRTRHRLPDPPGGVGRKLVPAAIVELLDRADQPERTLLNQVKERQPATEVALGDRHDESKVRLDHLTLRRLVAPLDPLCEVDLLVGSEQRDASDLA